MATTSPWSPATASGRPRRRPDCGPRSSSSGSAGRRGPSRVRPGRGVGDVLGRAVKNSYYASPHEPAAAYAVYSVQGHVFADGNKRTGAAADLPSPRRRPPWAPREITTTAVIEHGSRRPIALRQLIGSEPAACACGVCWRWSFPGGVAERSKAPVLKTGRAHALVGSNPTPSALILLGPYSARAGSAMVSARWSRAPRRSSALAPNTKRITWSTPRSRYRFTRSRSAGLR